MSLPTPHLLVDGLGQRFGRRVLFSGFAFELAPGDALAVTGANGAGKSTLLQILAGLLTPTAGSVRLRVGGDEVPQEARPLQVGFVAPYLNVYDEFSARENLGFIAQARRLPRAGERIAAVLERVGLGGREDDLVKTYSSGMRQRVRFAAALLPEPAVLLLDEPGSNLDAAGRDLVGRVVAEQRAAGGIVALATNVEAEATLCDKRIVVGSGEDRKRGGTEG